MTEKILNEIACRFSVKELEKWYHDLREATEKHDVNGIIETLEIVRGCARYYALDFDVYPDNIRALYVCNDIYLYDYGINDRYVFAPVSVNISQMIKKRLHEYLIQYKDILIALKAGANPEEEIPLAGHLCAKLDSFLTQTHGAGIAMISYVTDSRIEIKLDSGEYVEAYDSRKRD